MVFELITIFPDFFHSPLEYGVIGKAVEAGIVKISPVNLRDFTRDRHKTTDDRPFGGGEGMVMLPEPVFCALEHLRSHPPAPFVVFPTPRGIPLTQKIICDLAEMERIVIICGRYEGLDERICENCVDLEVSIGDYVLSGGELPALVIVDAVSRLLPGVLGCATSAENDSFTNGLLEHPHYTRPRDFMGWKVPDILVSGNHEKIARWRRKQSVLITARRRPDLLEKADLTSEDLKWLDGVTSD